MSFNITATNAPQPGQYTISLSQNAMVKKGLESAKGTYPQAVIDPEQRIHSDSEGRFVRVLNKQTNEFVGAISLDNGTFQTVSSSAEFSSPSSSEFRRMQ